MEITGFGMCSLTGEMWSGIQKQLKLEANDRGYVALGDLDDDTKAECFRLMGEQISAHPDSDRVRVAGSDSFRCLVGFLGSLKNLWSLTLVRLGTRIELPSASTYDWIKVDSVMEGLTSLKIDGIRSTFAEYLCARATNLKTQT